MIEYLPGKDKALSSNSSIVKIKERKKEKIKRVTPLYHF
jgi:hypothetical protein